MTGREAVSQVHSAASDALRDVFEAARRAREAWAEGPRVAETGTVISVERGTALVSGLSEAGSEEVLRFSSGGLGMALNLDPVSIGAVLLDANLPVEAGEEVRRTGRLLSVPVGDHLLGRVVDPVGRPLDGGALISGTRDLPVERPAPSLLARAPVARPLHTGIKIVDALIPVGRGQRELILGDRQTGKTTLAVETIQNQARGDVVCVYCAMGQRDASVNRVIDSLRRSGMLASTVVVVAAGDDAPGLQFVAPFAATSIAEHFVQHGRDVLIVYDDLTRHAHAYRELSLLLRRPPGREAFPGDIFYLHARLLERAAQLTEEAGGGSLTALPIAETEAENLTAYIPTNLISITDGQIYLSPRLFEKSVLPAVDVGLSVSRVGAQAQLPAFRSLAGDLRLSYAQFLELEVFSRFATQLDEETRRTLERGRRVREILKQPAGVHMSPADQVFVLLAVTGGALDEVSMDELGAAQERVIRAAREELPLLAERIEAGERITPAERELFLHGAALAAAAA
jgi:F-type H+-transporting ATPase subunit alpha